MRSLVLHSLRRCFHVAHTSVPGTDSLFPARSRPDRLATPLSPARRQAPAGGPGGPRPAQPLTVTSPADGGVGTLRDAIADARRPANDTIDFATDDPTITLTSGELAIAKNLDIEGPGANKLTISGNDHSRVFDISPGETVTIAGLTIADGLATGAPSISQR